jgi:hypothetical protein
VLVAILGVIWEFLGTAILRIGTPGSKATTGRWCNCRRYLTSDGTMFLGELNVWVSLGYGV